MRPWMDNEKGGTQKRTTYNNPYKQFKHCPSHVLVALPLASCFSS